MCLNAVWQGSYLHRVWKAECPLRLMRLPESSRLNPDHWSEQRDRATDGKIYSSTISKPPQNCDARISPFSCSPHVWADHRCSWVSGGLVTDSTSTEFPSSRSFTLQFCLSTQRSFSVGPFGQRAKRLFPRCDHDASGSVMVQTPAFGRRVTTSTPHSSLPFGLAGVGRRSSIQDTVFEPTAWSYILDMRASSTVQEQTSCHSDDLPRGFRWSRLTRTSLALGPRRFPQLATARRWSPTVHGLPVPLRGTPVHVWLAGAVLSLNLTVFPSEMLRAVCLWLDATRRSETHLCSWRAPRSTALKQLCSSAQLHLLRYWLAETARWECPGTGRLHWRHVWRIFCSVTPSVLGGSIVPAKGPLTNCFSTLWQSLRSDTTAVPARIHAQHLGHMRHHWTLSVVGHFDFVYVPVDSNHCASYGFAFFDDRAEHVRTCSPQCTRTCCQDVTDVSVFPAEVVDAKTSLEESPVAVHASFSVGHLWRFTLCFTVYPLSAWFLRSRDFGARVSVTDGDLYSASQTCIESVQAPWQTRQGLVFRSHGRHQELPFRGSIFTVGAKRLRRKYLLFILGFTGKLFLTRIDRIGPFFLNMT